jgi:phosphosulfolactate synthase
VTRTADYLSRIGVPEMPPSTSPFDPGYDLSTLEGHLQQSWHLMSRLKVSMACWIIAQEEVSRRKIATAASYNVPTVFGGGPFEVAVAQNRLTDYLDLCVDMGVNRIECGEGFTELPFAPEQVLRMARERGLEVQFELGSKHGGAFTDETVDNLLRRAAAWFDAGAAQVVIEARESAAGVGLFDLEGDLNRGFAEAFVAAYGLANVVFEAPTKSSQFALLDHLGPEAQLANVRLEELLRVEIYRRGLHSDAFGRANLRPKRPDGASSAE